MPRADAPDPNADWDAATAQVEPPSTGVSNRDVHGALAAADDGMTEADIQQLMGSADMVLYQNHGGGVARVYVRRTGPDTHEAAVRRFPEDGPITSFRNMSESSLQNRMNSGRWYSHG